MAPRERPTDRRAPGELEHGAARIWGRQCFLEFGVAAEALPHWERHYNVERFSLALNGETPAEKLARRLPDAKIA